jgi:hypothetical protein
MPIPMSRSFLVLAVALFAVGCGSGLKTAPVSGVITKDGQPLANASVTFTPQATGGESPVSNGRTDDKGSYTLAITATGDSGAVLGNHIVRVAAIGEEQTGPNSDVSDPKVVDPIPPHSLTFEVKSGQNQADFDLKSR